MHLYESCPSYSRETTFKEDNFFQGLNISESSKYLLLVYIVIWLPYLFFDIVLQNEMAAVLNRTFHYTGQFVPVKWKCRAPLPSGKLCERMDRVKVIASHCLVPVEGLLQWYPLFKS